ncbi:zinc finger (ccch type) motif-containing protein, partial [Cystoisospora suis]
MVFDRGMSLVNMPKHPASRRSSSSVTSSSQGRGGGRGSPRDGQQHQPSPTTATGPDKASPQQLTSTTLPTAGGGEDRSHGVVPKNASLISIDSRLPPEPQSDAIREEGGTAMRPARVSDQKSGSGAGLEGDKPSKGSTRDNSDTRALTKDDSNPSAKLYDAAASPSIPQSNWVDVTAGSRGSRGGGGGGGRSPSRKKGHSVTAASSTCTATAWSVPQGGTGCGAEGSVAGGAGGVKVAGPKTGDGASNDKIQSGQTQEVPDLLLFSAFPPLSAAASTSPPPSSHSTEGDKGISCVTKKDNQGENEDPAVVISAPSDGKAVTASGQNSTDLSGKDEGLVGPCCVGSVAVASPPDAFLVSKIQPPPPPPLSERKRGTSVVVSGVTGGESFSTSYQPESLTTEKADDATRPSSCSPPYPSSPLPLWGQGGAVRGGGTYSYYTDNTNIWATGTRTSENSSTAKQKEQQPHYLHAASSSSSSCATSVSSEAAPCADDVFDEAGDPVAGAALLAPIIVADRRSAFLKTQMCQHVSAGRCRMGEQCRYAHSREELRPAPQLDKTMMCATIKAGKVCPRGSACTFAHSRRELRQTIDHYKTNMCRNWLQGRCSKPNTCNHAHGEQELLFYRRLAATRGCRNFTKEQKHMGQITGSTSLPGGGGGQLLPPSGKGSAQQLSPGQSLQHHSKGGAGVTPFFSVHGQTEFSAQYRQDTAPGPVLTENENTLQRSSGGREEGSSNLPPQSAAIEPFNSDVFPSSTGSAKNVGCCSMVIMARTRDGNMTRLPRRNSFFSQSNDGGPLRDSAVGALSQEAVRGRRVGEEEWGFHPSMIGAEDWRTLHRPGRAEQADESRHETEGSGIRVDLQRSGVDEAFEDERTRRFPESVLAHRGMQQPLHADGGESHSGEGGGPYGTGQFEAVGSGEQGFINNGDVIHR